MRGLRAAASLLTRVKVGGDVRWPEDIAVGLPWFPVVGGAVGCAVAGVYALGRPVLPPLVAAAVAVGLGAWLTGAFHEDGLADTADAFGHRRHADDTRRILKDPRLGTYGVVSLVLTMLVRVGAVAALDGGAAFAVLTAAHAMSRAGSLVLLTGPVAESDGLGSSSATVVANRHVVAAVGVAAGVGILTVGTVVIPSAAGIAIVCLGVGRLAWRRIGGVTGDVLGAAQQLGELVVLLICVSVIAHGWLHIPWW